MRHYPINSPQAAGRIVALTLLADGHLCKRELDVLDQLDAHGQLGLAQGELHAVVHGFCEDLLATANGHWGATFQLDARMLSQLLSDVEDPVLRCRVLALCTAIVEADLHVADGESLVLLAAIEHWGLAEALLYEPARGLPA